MLYLIGQTYLKTMDKSCRNSVTAQGHLWDFKATELSFGNEHVKFGESVGEAICSATD